jgi:hypothetical protein
MRKGSRTVGYVVTWEGYTMAASRNKQHPGVLFISHIVTLFSTRAAAQRAIRKSTDYGVEQAMPWSDKYATLRVVSA